MRILFSVISMIVIITLSINCGQNGDIDEARNFLPEAIDEYNIERVSEIRVFRGDSLWEYINGGAELYHDYNFVEVATADYKKDEVEFVADIYRFDISLNAYGLYTNFRPPSHDVSKLGVEGYKSPASMNFVKGNYLVRLTGYDETEPTENALAATARTIDSVIPGTTDYPEMFSKFYPVDKIEQTDRYQTKSFLGRGYLTEFYTQAYLIAGDTVTMFLSADSGEVKCNRWIEDLKSDTSFIEEPQSNITANGRFFSYRDPYYNQIIVFFDKGFLFGIINAKNEHADILKEWVLSLSVPG